MEENICKNCGHHRNFHYNEFTREDSCTFGTRISEDGVILDGCKCKEFEEAY